MNALVAYASRRGSTAEIAEAIAETLRQSGFGVDCMDVGDVKSLDGYDAVVLGSAVYIKRWRGDASRFLRKHAGELAQRPLWVFSSGPVGVPPDEEVSSEWTEPPRIVKQVERLGARDHVVFGGRMPDRARLPGLQAWIDATPPQDRDKRDWDEIRAWAARIAKDLSGRLRETVSS